MNAEELRSLVIAKIDAYESLFAGMPGEKIKLEDGALAKLSVISPKPSIRNRSLTYDLGQFNDEQIILPSPLLVHIPGVQLDAPSHSVRLMINEAPLSVERTDTRTYVGGDILSQRLTTAIRIDKSTNVPQVTMFNRTNWRSNLSPLEGNHISCDDAAWNADVPSLPEEIRFLDAQTRGFVRADGYVHTGLALDTRFENVQEQGRNTIHRVNVEDEHPIWVPQGAPIVPIGVQYRPPASLEVASDGSLISGFGAQLGQDVDLRECELVARQVDFDQLLAGVLDYTRGFSPSVLSEI